MHHAKIVHFIIFCVIHFSTLCGICTVNRQYKELPGRVAYIHVCCMQLLEVFFYVNSFEQC